MAKLYYSVAEYKKLETEVATLRALTESQKTELETATNRIAELQAQVDSQKEGEGIQQLLEQTQADVVRLEGIVAALKGQAPEVSRVKGNLSTGTSTGHASVDADLKAHSEALELFKVINP